ncbi:hypothetical protein C0Q70_13095 [Pomacea canaliculata]|uniref:Purple acid phosphatase n=1 Tax=Pomacea canaliculata TaxID=400727 RepID=A0A2T7NW89_POMCA|nr:hypothetical protein C0Q70_13095 [Pomacea canaliculata]
MGFGWSTHAVLLVLVLPAVLGSVYPEQVHLSYTDKPSEMVVTWVTQDKTKESKVRFGQSSLEYTAEGHTTTFVDGGSQHRKIYIHRARLHGLKPGESYEGWSKQFNFRAMKDGSDWSPKMMVYGDMGSRNDRALPYLQHNAHTGHFDAVLHVGDFAYDMHDDDARVGDDFMRQIEPIAAYVPYMTCVGNHEIAYDFGNYRHRFTMPGGDGTGMYFSWNIGPAHIISFNTEVYYYQSATTEQHQTTIRNGTAAFWPNLEDLFYKYGVDVEFYAHEHSYERLLPVYKGKVCGGSSEPYTNPRAPVHIITGSAGDKEGQDRFQYHPAAWSAFRSDDYGFTVMDIVNSTHLTLHQVSSDKGGQVIDSMVLIKEKHGAGSYTCDSAYIHTSFREKAWHHPRCRLLTASADGAAVTTITDKTSINSTRQKASTDSDASFSRTRGTQSPATRKMGFGWNTSPVLLMLIMPAVWGLKNVPPEQVHLSYTGNSTEMVVTWVTQDTTSTSTVMYGLSDLNLTASGSMTTFVDGGSQHRKLYIHRVTLTGLLPGHKYAPLALCDVLASGILYHRLLLEILSGHLIPRICRRHRAMKDGSDWSPKMMVYGDMGSRNDRALPYLQHNAHTGHFDAVLHVGDFAYDMHDNNARVGDDFMRQIEPIAAYVPYMTCVGNHEYAYWNIGPAHIISFNTEVYYYQYATTHNIKRQYDWLEADLKEANQPANRAARPWIITMGHRPMYCSNDDDDEMCRNPANPIRNGIAAFWPNLEDLFYKYGVDVEFYAHEHSYERLLPVYKGKVTQKTLFEPYTNPRSPVHIITGSAGDKEGQEKFLHHPAAWSAFRSDDYGFTVMDIVNSTHLTLQQVSSDKNGHVIDSIVLIKDKHGAGLYNCV